MPKNVPFKFEAMWFTYKSVIEHKEMMTRTKCSKRNKDVYYTQEIAACQKEIEAVEWKIFWQCYRTICTCPKPKASGCKICVKGG